jgi:hypothetical protein
MTIEQFDDECTKRGYRTMEVGGKRMVVNPANGQDFPWHGEVYQDLVAFHGEKAGSDLLEGALKILEQGIEKPWFAM